MARLFFVRPGHDARTRSMHSKTIKADSESLLTPENNLAESSAMRGDYFDIRAVLFGFQSTSRHGIPRRSPRNSNLDEVTANNGAAENCSARHGSCFRRRLSAHHAAPAPPSAVAELGVVSRLRIAPTRRPAKDILLTTPTLTRRLTKPIRTLSL